VSLPLHYDCNAYGCGWHVGGSNFFRKLFFKANFLKISVKVRVILGKVRGREGGGEGRGQIYLILWLGQLSRYF